MNHATSIYFHLILYHYTVNNDYTWYNIRSTWFLDIRISTCYSDSDYQLSINFDCSFDNNISILSNNTITKDDLEKNLQGGKKFCVI